MRSSSSVDRPSSASCHWSAIIRPSAIFRPPSSISHRPSVIVHQSSSISHRPSGIVHQSSSISHRPSTIVRQSSFVRHRTSVIFRQSSSVNHRPSIIVRQSSSVIVRPCVRTSVRPCLRVSVRPYVRTSVSHSVDWPGGILSLTGNFVSPRCPSTDLSPDPFVARRNTPSQRPYHASCQRVYVLLHADDKVCRPPPPPRPVPPPAGLSAPSDDVGIPPSGL